MQTKQEHEKTFIFRALAHKPLYAAKSHKTQTYNDDPKVTRETTTNSNVLRQKANSKAVAC